MTIGCNIWMIWLILIWFFYGLSRMFQLPQFVKPLRSSVWDVFINFLLIDATDRSKISSDQKRFFIALSLYPLSFFLRKLPLSPLIWFRKGSVSPLRIQIKEEIGNPNYDHKNNQSLSEKICYRMKKKNICFELYFSHGCSNIPRTK